MRPLSAPRLFAKGCLAATMGLALTLSAAAPASAVQPPADETGIVTSGDTAKDVPANSQFYKEIAWLAEQGITKGWDDGTYRPGEPIHRDAMAAFLYRYSDKVLK